MVWYSTPDFQHIIYVKAGKNPSKDLPCFICGYDVKDKYSLVASNYFSSRVVYSLEPQKTQPIHSHHTEKDITWALSNKISNNHDGLPPIAIYHGNHKLLTALENSNVNRAKQSAINNMAHNKSYLRI